ncbi:MAG TPA: transcription-repair coupling factor [Bacilli bacterium]|nr:transcription-repair coupling factor [Bacilli bacterium]
MDEVIGPALFTAASFLENPQNYILVAANMYVAQRLLSFLQTFISGDDLLFYPHDDLLQTEIISASKELEAQRLYTLYKLTQGGKHIVVTSVGGFTRFTIEKEKFVSHIITLHKKVEYNLEHIVATLSENGYQRVNKIDQTLQFALRGDILDIYSVNSINPIRVEFFGNQIESIRHFDIATQNSIDEIESTTIVPASEVVVDEETLEKLFKIMREKAKKDSTKLDLASEEFLLENIEAHIDTIKNRSNTSQIYKYFSLLDVFHHGVIEFVDNPTVVIVNRSQVEISETKNQMEAIGFLNEQSEKQRTVKDLSYFRGLNKILTPYSQIISIEEFATMKKQTKLDLSPFVTTFTNLNDFALKLNEHLAKNERVLISANNNAQLNTIEELLKLHELEYSLNQAEAPITLTYDYYPQGFEFVEQGLVVYTSKELFNAPRNNLRFSHRFKSATILHTYEQLQPGDYVVHEYHGIGKFLDVITRDSSVGHRDFLQIEYGAEDMLFVPLEQFQLVRKYSGREGVAPKLNRLSSNLWEKTKKRIKERINEIADQLIATQAERVKNKGFSFEPDDELQAMFESSFPYVLTDDQRQSLDEIKKDMESEVPMDRLLCGDVGFGKTEVALRAAFKAISNKKQVAFLCPTTLLARQHFELAKDRFAKFGIRVAHLSRLVPEKVQQETIKLINEGRYDIVIGTHRLLSKQISFKDLGLLIVDEEQRFGVEQKEVIKQFKASIDVLTLSATPIPRTLQMALVGMRALSQINTAPSDRMPIQTYVIPRRDGVVKELVERELQREGQVFYLHNRVKSIYETANKIARMVKEAKVGVVHGQMDRDSIEDVMMKFYSGDINVLVCTSIIENGIDVPNANMIIVENAGSFGLAQLYQIKGRVGRGDRIAFAYLLYTEGKNLTDDGRKRLKAIQEFTELGSGYKIAQRDLMIRGAGDILGAEQAGFIDSVGIDMYIKLLNETMAEKRQGVKPKEEEIKITTLLSIDAYIPEHYANKPDKIELYQAIKATKTLSEVKRLEEKTRDIYGKLPVPVSLLFRKRIIDIILGSRNKYVETIIDDEAFIEVIVGDIFMKVPGSGTMLFESLNQYVGGLRVSIKNNKMSLKIYKLGDWFTIFERVVLEIVRIIRQASKKNEN